MSKDPIFAIPNENGLVVQLVRMPPCHGGGRGFESRPVRKSPSHEGLFALQHHTATEYSELPRTFVYSVDPDKGVCSMVLAIYLGKDK